MIADHGQTDGIGEPRRRGQVFQFGDRSVQRLDLSQGILFAGEKGVQRLREEAGPFRRGTGAIEIRGDAEEGVGEAEEPCQDLRSPPSMRS